VPPRCGIWARGHHAEMTFMNELWFAVVPPPSAPTNFLMLLPKASTNFFFFNSYSKRKLLGLDYAGAENEPQFKEQRRGGGGGGGSAAATAARAAFGCEPPPFLSELCVQ